MTSKVLFVVAFCMWMLLPCMRAQSVSYAYDSNGNRIAREFTIGTNKSANMTADNDISPLIEGIDTYEIKIFPNPTHGMLKVVIDGINDEYIMISIYDLRGHIVYHKDKAANENIIDLTGQENGIYVMDLIKKDEKRTWKIIKK